MARMRTVKPEFWEDEVVGCLTRDARLLFVATWNLADDEGLLRWTPSYLKANVFMYDDDISNAMVELLMKELAGAEVIFPYVAGKARQQLGYVVNFHKHQRVNRPQPSKLPPPPIQNGAVLQMYGRRDGMICHLCKGDIVLDHDRQREWLSLDHLVPRSQGGSDYPSNIKASHVSCNKARCDRPVESFRGSPVTRARNDSVNDSRDRDEPFTAGVVRGKGVVGEKEEESARAPADEPDPEPPPQVQRPDGLTSIPDDFAPTDSMRRWAIATFGEMDLNFETAQFAAHYRSTGARRKSWPDQWQKWVRDSAKRRSDQSLRAAARASPNGVLSRRQQADNELFDRAMQRATAREESAGDPP